MKIVTDLHQTTENCDPLKAGSQADFSSTTQRSKNSQTTFFQQLQSNLVRQMCITKRDNGRDIWQLKNAGAKTEGRIEAPTMITTWCTKISTLMDDLDLSGAFFCLQSILTMVGVYWASAAKVRMAWNWLQRMMCRCCTNIWHNRWQKSFSTTENPFFPFMKGFQKSKRIVNGSLEWLPKRFTIVNNFAFVGIFEKRDTMVVTCRFVNFTFSLQSPFCSWTFKKRSTIMGFSWSFFLLLLWHNNPKSVNWFCKSDEPICKLLGLPCMQNQNHIEWITCCGKFLARFCACWNKQQCCHMIFS